MTSSSFSKIPAIRVWNILLVPLQGEVDDELAGEMSHEVLQTLYTSEVDSLVIDVTGLWLMDSHMCSVLSRLASSAALMGVRTVLCGMSAEIAVTLQTMRLELHGVATAPTLEDALETLGIRPDDPDEYDEEDEQPSTDYGTPERARDFSRS